MIGVDYEIMKFMLGRCRLLNVQNFPIVSCMEEVSLSIVHRNLLQGLILDRQLSLQACSTEHNY